MTTLVIGASGQVGGQLHALLSRRGPCLGTSHTHEADGLVPLDIRDVRAVERLVRQVAPHTCYLPAAFTNVDRAEMNREACYAVNVTGVRNVARALAELGSTLVFFSTEHVFGDGDWPRRENEPIAPLSMYARSKAWGEQIVAATLPDRHLILRTSWVYGPDAQAKNFVYRVRRMLSRGEVLTVPADQHGQPTYAPDLAATAAALAEREARGVFHVTGPEYLSRLEWAERIAAGLDLPLDGIRGVMSVELKQPAPRPRHVRLSRQRLLSFLEDDPIRSPRNGIESLRKVLDALGWPEPAADRGEASVEPGNDVALAGWYAGPGDGAELRAARPRRAVA